MESSTETMSRFLSILAVLIFAVPLRADVALPKAISSHMVIQSEMPVRIFGTADDGEKVTVTLAGRSGKPMQEKSVVAADGKWLVELAPIAPNLELTLTIKGNNTIVLKDILSGEVWHVSGQSNMRYPLARIGLSEEDFATLDYPRIRYMFAPSGRWSPIRPSRKRSGTLSALAFFFAEALHKQTGRPVGIIDSSVNGAGAQQFIDVDVINRDSGLTSMLKPHGLPLGNVYKKRIAPIVPYTVRGVFWCQGEANRDYPMTYRRLLKVLMADWRRQWGQPSMPFIIVQNANYQAYKPVPWDGGDCAIRDVQLKTVQNDNHAALVVAIDLGIATNVHYPNKKPAGQRAALCARALAHKEDVVYSGPLFKSVEFKDGKAIVSFTHVGGGLTVRGDELEGFLLSGKNRQFVRAKATLQGDTVVVSSPEAPDPVSVRYAWERNPKCNLYNKEGLPASPFRSDSFVNYFTRDKKAGEN